MNTPFTAQEKDNIIEKVLEGLRNGLPEYKAAVDGGASYPTWWRWRQEIPGLNERTTEAKRGRIVLLEDALYKAALKGSVTAALTLLRKESKEWRELIDGQIVPAAGNQAALAGAAAAGASAVLMMLSGEKRLRLKKAMYADGMLALPQPGTNGTNGNGNGTGH